MELPVRAIPGQLLGDHSHNLAEVLPQPERVLQNTRLQHRDHSFSDGQTSRASDWFDIGKMDAVGRNERRLMRQRGAG
jgi:hypothetical protein